VLIRPSEPGLDNKSCDVMYQFVIFCYASFRFLIAALSFVLRIDLPSRIRLCTKLAPHFRKRIAVLALFSGPLVDAVFPLQRAHIGYDIRDIRDGDALHRRHVAKRPVMRAHAVLGCHNKGHVAMVIWLIDAVHERRGHAVLSLNVGAMTGRAFCLIGAQAHLLLLGKLRGKGNGNHRPTWQGAVLRSHWIAAFGLHHEPHARNDRYSSGKKAKFYHIVILRL
jgi:hypothetical protein